MVNQVMEKLGVERYFALGTSQGGWVVVRMGLLEPGRVSSRFKFPKRCRS